MPCTYSTLCTSSASLASDSDSLDVATCAPISTSMTLCSLTVVLRFVTNPGYIHWLAALRVLYYVCNTALFGIVVKVGKSFKLSHVYVDSDHDGNVDDRKSISGYVIYLGSTPIFWCSKQQKGEAAERAKQNILLFLPVSMRLSGFKPFFVNLDFKSLYLYTVSRRQSIS